MRSVRGFSLLIAVFSMTQAFPISELTNQHARNKRQVNNLFNDFANAGKSFLNIGETILNNARDKFNVKRVNAFYIKDGERMCRRLQQPTSEYDMLCVENLAYSVFLSAIGSSFQFMNSFGAPETATTTKRPNLPTTTPANRGTVKIDVIFVRRTTTPKPTTTTKKPFDWPKFIMNIVHDFKKDMTTFGNKIQAEINTTADNLASSSASKSIIALSRTLDKVEDNLLAIGDKMKETVKSMNKLNENVDAGAKAIESSIDDAGKNISGAVDTGLSAINASINAQSEVMQRAMNESSKAVLESIGELSEILGKMANTLDDQSEYFTKLDEFPNLIEELKRQSVIFEEMTKILELIKEKNYTQVPPHQENIQDQISNITMDSDVRRQIEGIADNIGQINPQERNAPAQFGSQLVALGNIYRDNPELQPLLKTGKLYKDVGDLVRAFGR